MFQRSIPRRLFYDFLRLLCRIAAVVLFRIRCRGRHHMPPEGPVLVCSNHQSFLDPVFIGMVFQRRLNYLARKSLFRFSLFRELIEMLDAIPLEREGLGMAGLKESLRRLRQGEMVLIFPEGTRTPDGTVWPMKPGFCVLARRTNACLLPVAIDGAYDAWPRTARFPRPRAIRVCVGEPIGSDFVRHVDERQLVDELERRIRLCHDLTRAGRSYRRRAGGARSREE